MTLNADDLWGAAAATRRWAECCDPDSRGYFRSLGERLVQAAIEQGASEEPQRT